MGFSYTKICDVAKFKEKFAKKDKQIKGVSSHA